MFGNTGGGGSLLYVVLKTASGKRFSAGVSFKEVNVGTVASPVNGEDIERFFGEYCGTIFCTFSLFHMKHHSASVDTGHFKGSTFVKP
jgi:hypothetical protein